MDHAVAALRDNRSGMLYIKTIVERVVIDLFLGLLSNAI